MHNENAARWCSLALGSCNHSCLHCRHHATPLSIRRPAGLCSPQGLHCADAMDGLHSPALHAAGEHCSTDMCCCWGCHCIQCGLWQFHHRSVHFYLDSKFIYTVLEIRVMTPTTGPSMHCNSNPSGHLDCKGVQVVGSPSAGAACGGLHVHSICSVMDGSLHQCFRGPFLSSLA